MDPILQFFEYRHLPKHLQDVSAQFYAMAHWIVEVTPRNPERTTALRKLLEAKDCAVRARLYKDPQHVAVPPVPPKPTRTAIDIDGGRIRDEADAAA